MVQHMNGAGEQLGPTTWQIWLCKAVQCFMRGATRQFEVDSWHCKTGSQCSYCRTSVIVDSDPFPMYVILRWHCCCCCWLQSYRMFSWTPTDVPSPDWSGRSGNTRERRRPWWNVVLVRSSVKMRKPPRWYGCVQKQCTRPSRCDITFQSTYSTAHRFLQCPSHRNSPSDFVQKPHAADSCWLHVLFVMCKCCSSVHCLLDVCLYKVCSINSCKITSFH